jgi:hypothetical protein
MSLGKFRSGVKTLGTVLGVSCVYVFAIITTSLLSPQKIINIGDSYCEDIWCIGVEAVSAQPQGQNVQYNVAVRIFSDANHTKVSAKGASLYLLDEHGRRFNLVSDPAVVPFDMTLNPRQSINTTLTFVTSSDVRQLFLTGAYGNSLEGKRPPFIARFLVSLYIGSDNSLMHKPTLLRVL